MLESNLQPDRDHSTQNIYNLEKFDSSVTFRYNELFKQIEQNQEHRKTFKKDIKKRLLTERISGVWGFGSAEGFSYLEHNAQTRGDFYNTDIIDLKYAENITRSCKSNAIWFQGEQSQEYYLKVLDCRKQWCPECGGKNGTIHNSRLHAILTRFDPNKYWLRQFVFTIPEHIRIEVMTKKELKYLYESAKEIIEKYFGEPQFDKKGHVKRYKLHKGAIGYLHLFGDTPGIFKPHINVHVIEQKNTILKLDAELLGAIKQSWAKKLRKINPLIDVVDVHYSFRNSPKKVMHAIKYMSRPWSADDFNAITDEKLKRLLVIELSGFQYLRFWGAMASCKYKDEMDLTEIQVEAERKVNEPLRTLFIAPFNLSSWKEYLDEIEVGFYKIKKKGLNYGPEIQEKLSEAEKFKHC